MNRLGFFIGAGDREKGSKRGRGENKFGLVGQVH
jgi:hypothetical protein